MKDLATKNHGKESFICSDSHLIGIEGYFECLKYLKPLFKKPGFRDSTPSFYINYIRNDQIGNPGSVRLNYFTNDGEETQKIIHYFIRETPAVKLLYCEDARKDPDDSARTAPGENDNEERWRNFCRVYSYIGLDLLYYNILCSRKLALDYRLNYFSRGLPAKRLFETPFRNHSNFFKNELDGDYPAEKLWEDLDSPWNHFLVNILLPGEPHEFFPGINYNSLTEEQKTYISQKLDVDLPEGWKSNCLFQRFKS